MTRKRILEEFEINEISIVDRPAQKPARITIIKSEQPTKELEAMTFEERIDHIRSLEKCGKLEALQIARQRYPKAFSEYQNAPVAMPEQIAKSNPHREVAVGLFEKAVDEVLALEPKLTRTMAMSKVRKLKPGLYMAAFE